MIYNSSWKLARIRKRDVKYCNKSTVLNSLQFWPEYLKFFHALVRFPISKIRSSRQEVFSKKDVLKNLTEFTGKHLCWNLFFNKVAGFRPTTLLKQRLQHSFPVNSVKLLRTPFFTEHLQWLLLLNETWLSSQGTRKYGGLKIKIRKFQVNLTTTKN